MWCHFQSKDFHFRKKKSKMKIIQSCLTLAILEARILEWVAGLSRGSSQPRNQTGISCTAGGFFTS